MAGVTADSVVVLIEAKTREYEAAIDAAAKKTEAALSKMREATKNPVTLNLSAKTTSEINKVVASNKRLSASEKELAGQVTRSVNQAIAARNREAAAAVAAASRIVRARAMSGTSLGGSGAGRGGGPSVSPYTAINRAIRESIELQKQLNAVQASGSAALREQITFLRTINRLRRAGLSDAQALERAEQRILEIRRRQANAGRDRRPLPPTPPGPGPGPRPDGGGSEGGGSTYLGGLRGAVGAFVGAYAGISGAREYLELTDAYKQYNAQLRLATAENGNLAQAQADTQRIAAETRSGLTETAQLYGTFQRNAAQLGLTQEQSARATEIITKSFKISGATASEAAGGLRQFLQALQSGQLRGEEFNSVVENAPRLAKIFADQLTNGNVGALRALAFEGKITGDEIKKALGDPQVYEQIKREFNEIPVTFEDAMTTVRNAAIITFGAFDEGGDISKALVNFITGGSEGFADLAKAASDQGSDIRATFEALSNAFDPLLAGAQNAFGGIRQEANYTRESIYNILNGIDQLRNFLPDLQRRAQAFDERTFGRRLGFTGDIGPRSDISGDFLRRGDALRARQQGRRLDAMFGGEGNLSAFVSGQKNVFGQLTSLPGNRPKVNADVKKYQELNADLEKLKSGANARELKTINQKIAKNNQIIDNLNKGVSIQAARAAVPTGRGRSGPSAETLAKRAEAERLRGVRKEDAYNSEVERLNSAILSAKGKQAQTIESSYEAAVAGADADLKQAETKYQNQLNEGKITDQQRKVLVGLAGQVRAQEVLTANTERAAALASDALQRQADAANNQADAIRAQLDVTISRTQREKLQNQLIEKEYEARRASLLERYQGAAPGSAESLSIEGQLANLPAQQAAEEFRSKQDNRGTYQRYRESLTGVDSLSEDIDNIKVEVLDRVADSLSTATTNALGLTGALGDVVGQIIKIGIQRRLIGPLADGLFGAAGGGSAGTIGGILTSILGGARASGGDVSAGKLYRINENGPEYFQPAMSGKIIPTGRAAGGNGGTTVVQHISVDGRNSVTPAGFASQILNQANRFAAKAATDAGKSSYESSPARYNKFQQLGS